MKFKELVAPLLKNDLTKKELSVLPTGFQVIGDIAVLSLPESLMKKARVIGGALMQLHSRVKTVCVKQGVVTGVKRLPLIKKVLGGDTETVHKESGILFKLDVVKVMFSKGNLFERSRLVKQVRKGEVVVDLFAGIGYFTIPLAKFSKANHVWAVEINPVSFGYLEENIVLNKVSNVTPVLGDCRKVKLPRADRVLMGYLPSAKPYLSTALKILKKDGFLHYHTVARSEKEALAEVLDVTEKLKLVGARKVKSYGNKKWHWVLDFTSV